ncbi:hypothetical protein BpHYR1_030120 [Brachionus plicatilis]|uniref:Uncharacterized protein n=1 Tax=Brachionus plicatilis TaxID=10195 RepID=A0A3M7RML3_BRAPC|nr:hypothetical protein BpHYR1_030120 [Brachionus plicatilis]
MGVTFAIYFKSLKINPHYKSQKTTLDAKNTFFIKENFSLSYNLVQMNNENINIFKLPYFMTQNLTSTSPPVRTYFLLKLSTLDFDFRVFFSSKISTSPPIDLYPALNVSTRAVTLGRGVRLILKFESKLILKYKKMFLSHKRPVNLVILREHRPLFGVDYKKDSLASITVQIKFLANFFITLDSDFKGFLYLFLLKLLREVVARHNFKIVYETMTQYLAILKSTKLIYLNYTFST